MTQAEVFARIRQLLQVSGDNGYLPRETGGLPGALAAYYQAFGKEERFCACPWATILPPDKLVWQDDWIILNEKSLWCIARADWNKADPPVYVIKEPNKMEEKYSTFTEFLYVQMHIQALFSLPWRDGWHIEQAQTEWIIHTYHMIDNSFHNIAIFTAGKSGVIAVDMLNGYLCFAATEQQEYEQLSHGMMRHAGVSGASIEWMWVKGRQFSEVEQAARQYYEAQKEKLFPVFCYYEIKARPDGALVLFSGRTYGMEAARVLSDMLQTDVVYFRVQEQKFWFYLLFQNGAAVDGFSPLPDYWETRCPALIGCGRPLLARTMEVPPQEIEWYYSLWFGGRNTMQAYSEDTYCCGDWRQLKDLFHSLGLPFLGEDCGARRVDIAVYPAKMPVDSNQTLQMENDLLYYTVSGTLGYPVAKRFDLEKLREFNPYSRHVRGESYELTGAVHFTSLLPAGDFSALQYAVNMNSLVLADLYVNDFSFLTACTKLRRLNLRHSGFEDVSLLKNLKELRWLDLSSNPQLVNLETLRELPRLSTVVLDKSYAVKRWLPDVDVRYSVSTDYACPPVMILERRYTTLYNGGQPLRDEYQELLELKKSRPDVPLVGTDAVVQAQDTVLKGTKTPREANARPHGKTQRAAADKHQEKTPLKAVCTNTPDGAQRGSEKADAAPDGQDEAANVRAADPDAADSPAADSGAAGTLSAECLYRPQWDALTEEEKGQVLRGLAGAAPGISFLRLESFLEDGEPVQTGIFSCGEIEFVFVPGMRGVTLGWDAQADELAPELMQHIKEDLGAYAQQNSGKYDYTPVKKALEEDLKEYGALVPAEAIEAVQKLLSQAQCLGQLAYKVTWEEVKGVFLAHMSPRCTVDIAPMLCERVPRCAILYPRDTGTGGAFLPEKISGRYLFQTLNAIGTAPVENPDLREPFALPTEDEWEYLCGGGTRKVFWWGNTYPGVPDRLGLTIGCGSFPELVNGSCLLKGGDGGAAENAGEVPFLCALPQSPYYRGEIPLDNTRVLYRRIVRLGVAAHSGRPFQALPDTPEYEKRCAARAALETQWQTQRTLLLRCWQLLADALRAAGCWRAAAHCYDAALPAADDAAALRAYSLFCHYMDTKSRKDCAAFLSEAAKVPGEERVQQLVKRVQAARIPYLTYLPMTNETIPRREEVFWKDTCHHFQTSLVTMEAPSTLTAMHMTVCHYGRYTGRMEVRADKLPAPSPDAVTRPDGIVLWKYDKKCRPSPLLKKPTGERADLLAMLLRQFAARPYDLAQWTKAAQAELLPQMTAQDEAMLWAFLIFPPHPEDTVLPEPRPYEWVMRVQFLCVLLLSLLEEARPSLPLARICGGQLDWPVIAAVTILAQQALETPQCEKEVLEILEALAKRIYTRGLCFFEYPLVCALLRLPHLPQDRRTALEERRAALEE